MSQKFVNYSLSKARNGEHYEYYGVFTDYLTADIANALGFGSLYAEFTELFLKEKTIFTTLRIYEETAKIQDLDHERDELYSYVLQDIKNKLRSPIKKEYNAAVILNPFFARLSDAASETQAGETGTLRAFLEDLKEKHSKEIADIGLTVVIDKLEELNIEFQQILLSRENEAQRRKANSNMTSIRKEIDKKHIDIINMLNGLWLVLNINADAEKEKISILDELATNLNTHTNETFNNLKERGKRSETINN